GRHPRPSPWPSSLRGCRLPTTRGGSSAPHVLAEEAKHVGLPRRHAPVDKVVSVVYGATYGGIELQHMRLPQAPHLTGEGFSRGGRVIVDRVDEHHRRNYATDCREEP